MTRILLYCALFEFRSKVRAQDFTRKRKLTFSNMVVLMLCKGSKSQQLVLSEHFEELGIESVSGSAYTQARQKVRGKLFKELNHSCAVVVAYNGEYKTYLGHRVLAIDGSKLVLPDSESIRAKYGEVSVTNQHGEVRRYSDAMSSVLYDVLNKIALDAELDTTKIGERELALRHLESVQPGDLLLFDRGYPSGKFFKELKAKGVEFLCRLPSKWSNQTAEFLASGLSSNECELEGMMLRFIRVELDTGEVEILITSLTDNEKYPTEIFKDLYFKRWEIETYFDLIKSRLELENFTGKTPESVEQDFYSTIFLSNLESLLSNDINSELREKSTKHKQEVNKAVAFHSIKRKAFDLIISATPLEFVIPELAKLFKLNPTVKRQGRSKKNRKSQLRAKVNFYKRQKKRAI